MVNGHCGGFGILKKNNFSSKGQGQVQAWPGFQAQPILQEVQVLRGYSIFGPKTTSHSNPDVNNSFLWSDLPCEVVFWPQS